MTDLTSQVDSLRQWFLFARIIWAVAIALPLPAVIFVLIKNKNVTQPDRVFFWAIILDRAAIVFSFILGVYGSLLIGWGLYDFEMQRRVLTAWLILNSAGIFTTGYFYFIVLKRSSDES